MTKPIAYIETTVPNFYYDFRPDPAIVARRIWTRAWWASAQREYELVTGEEVLLELAAGSSQFVPLRLELLKAVPVLPLVPQVADIVQAYLKHKLMPRKPGGDAAHLALASSFGCDFIVTWNCRHLANPNKFAHIRRINHLLGLAVPEIVRPLDLLRRTR
jgi:predicted nucleic acid-binding protein